MNKEHTEYLIEKYPWMKDVPYGIAVGDGWFEIINQLCNYIDNAIKFENRCIERYKEHPEGFTWKPNDELFEYPRVNQIKEKFGGLRFYCSTPTGTRYEMQGAIDFAEAISFTICEDCGNKGKPSKVVHWIRTLCKDCFIAALDERSKDKTINLLTYKECLKEYEKNARVYR